MVRFGSNHGPVWQESCSCLPGIVVLLMLYNFMPAIYAVKTAF